MPIQTICTCSMSLTGFCARDIRECKNLFLTEMDNCYNNENMEEKKYPIKWEYKNHSYAIGDTGDYDGYWEVTNGRDSLVTKEDYDEIEKDLQAVVDLLNITYANFAFNRDVEAALEAENKWLRCELEELKKQPSAAWVKASTRMPEQTKQPRLYIVTWYDVQLFVRTWTANQLADWVKNTPTLDYYWLDESGAASPLTQSRADLIRETNSRDLEGIAAVPTAWIRADVKRPEGWQLARFLNSRKRFPVKFSPHVIADMVGKTYEPQELEYLSDEGAAAAGREEDKSQFDNWHRWLAENGYTYDGEYYYDQDNNYFTPDQLWVKFK